MVGRGVGDAAVEGMDLRILALPLDSDKKRLGCECLRRPLILLPHGFPLWRPSVVSTFRDSMSWRFVGPPMQKDLLLWAADLARCFTG